MNSSERHSVPRIGETIVRFSVFTGFWAIAYFFMCLTAFAVARADWTFTVRLDAILIWFALFVGLAVGIGNVIGVAMTLAFQDRIAATHNRFGGEFRGNLRQTLQFLVSVAVTSPIFLGLSKLAAIGTERWFQKRLDVMDGVSWSAAAAVIVLESLSVTGLVLAIVVYVKEQYERMRRA
jgi:hypothetical protein